MKKAVLNKDNSPQIVERILRLQADSQPLWGSFRVTEMMFHCATINHAILANRQNIHKPKWKQRFLGTLVLKVMKQLPKGIKTNPKYLKPPEDTAAFEEDRKRLLESIAKVAERTEEIYGTHPLLGSLDTLKWRRFIYMHLDHHLRQFGV